MVELANQTRSDLIAELDQIIGKQEQQEQLERIESARVSRVDRAQKAEHPLPSLTSATEEAQKALDDELLKTSREAGLFRAVKRRIFLEDVPGHKELDKIRPSTVATFGMLGAIGGGTIAGPPGAIIGGSVGAGIGAVAPETAVSIAEALGWVPEGTRDRVGRSNAQLQIIARGEAGGDILIGALAVLPRVVGRAVATSASAIDKSGRELAEFAAVKLGVNLLPFMVTPGETAAKNIINALGRLPLVGTPARKDVFLHFLRS